MKELQFWKALAKTQKFFVWVGLNQSDRASVEIDRDQAVKLGEAVFTGKTGAFDTIDAFEHDGEFFFGQAELVRSR